MFTPVNLLKWIDENQHLLKPPVSNKQVWVDDRENIVMIVGGPNARNDYHINSTEEFFFQVKGDINLRILDPETNLPRDIPIREGDIYLLPANVPHSPQRPKDTVGLVMEIKRPEGARDKLQWWCDHCHHLVHEAEFTLENIDVDLKEIMKVYWGTTDLRTCDNCGAVMEHPGEAQPLSA